MAGHSPERSKRRERSRSRSRSRSKGRSSKSSRHGRKDSMSDKNNDRKDSRRKRRSRSRSRSRERSRRDRERERRDRRERTDRNRESDRDNRSSRINRDDRENRENRGNRDRRDGRDSREKRRDRRSRSRSKDSNRDTRITRDRDRGRDRLERENRDEDRQHSRKRSRFGLNVRTDNNDNNNGNSGNGHAPGTVKNEWEDIKVDINDFLPGGENNGNKRRRREKKERSSAMSSIMAGKMGEGTEEQKDRACFIFQIDGYCKFGEDCRRAHRAGDDWTRVFCGDFLKTGDCRYGAEKCFRSHDLTRLNAQREQHRRHQRENQGPSLRSDVKVSGEGGENGGGEGEGEGEGGEPAKHVEKPNFAVSGALAKTENLVNGVVVKYAEPPDGRAPDKRWRLYVFKGDEELEPLRIHRLSSYMIGRERKVADVLVHHPSISKQHAVLQFRSRPTGKYDLNSGVPITKIKPYIIDLESTNGTMLNGKKIEPLKYYELLEEDCIKFGFSSRSYVLMEAAIDYGGVDLSKKNRSKLRKGFGDDDDDTSDDGEDYTK